MKNLWETQKEYISESIKLKLLQKCNYLRLLTPEQCNIIEKWVTDELSTEINNWFIKYYVPAIEDCINEQIEDAVKTNINDKVYTAIQEYFDKNLVSADKNTLTIEQ